MIEAITKAPINAVEKYVTDNMPLAALERIRRRAAMIKAKYEEIFLKFADVHKGINHTRAVTDGDIHRIGKLLFTLY